MVEVVGWFQWVYMSTPGVERRVFEWPFRNDYDLSEKTIGLIKGLQSTIPVA